MNMQKVEDIKDTALKLNAIRDSCPDDYFYLKGWIHCLLQKEGTNDNVSRNPPRQTALLFMKYTLATPILKRDKCFSRSSFVGLGRAP